MNSFAVLLWLTTLPAAVPGSAPQSEENLAAGAKYTLSPTPNYALCTDAGDATQLTDGRSTKDYFWTQQGTVGWSGRPYATITVDLGRVRPIGGAAFTTAAGVAGVTWPLAIHVLVSDDGKSYRDVGDLVSLDLKAHGPWPQKYAIRRLWTTELATRGRFVQFVAIPLSGGPYLFVDEVEVLRGPESLLQREPGGTPVAGAQALFERGRLGRAVQHRIETDAVKLETLIGTQRIGAAVAKPLVDRLHAIRRDSRPDSVALDPAFRAVLPLGDVHARIFHTQAELWRSLGGPPLAAWAACPWDPLEPIGIPPSGPAGTIEVHTLRGEYRAAAVNLANRTDRPMAVRLQFEGLLQSPQPSCVTVHRAEWTDTSQGEPVAAALPEAARTGDGWTVTVLPGLVRQVWLTFHVTDLPPAELSAALVMKPEGAESLRIPVRLRVWPGEFPKKTTLRLGGWSYTDGHGAYGVTPQNRAAFLAHLQSHFVNSPWASAAVMTQCRFSPDGQIRLDTARMDDWIAQWPQAAQYMVFLAAGDEFAGAKAGTPEFQRRVGTWISAWVRHLGARGIASQQLGLLIHDEPHEASDVRAMVAWAKAIRAAEPGVMIFEDPTYSNPAAAPAEMFEACTVLCPNRPMWLSEGQRFAQFYLDQQRRGRTLQLYSCSGPAKLLDPYSYYRLQAWHCWQIGATGSYFWAFGDNSGASSWCEYLAVAGPFTPLFLDAASVVPGKQMEAIRESVEDYEYLVMLRAAAQRAKAAGRSGPAVEKAEKLLAGAASKVLAAPAADQLKWHEPKDRTRADAVRIEVLQALTELR